MRKSQLLYAQTLFSQQRLLSMALQYSVVYHTLLKIMLINIRVLKGAGTRITVFVCGYNRYCLGCGFISGSSFADTDKKEQISSGVYQLCDRLSSLAYHCFK